MGVDTGESAPELLSCPVSQLNTVVGQTEAGGTVQNAMASGAMIGPATSGFPSGICEATGTLGSYY